MVTSDLYGPKPGSFLRLHLTPLLAISGSANYFLVFRIFLHLDFGTLFSFMFAFLADPFILLVSCFSSSWPQHSLPGRPARIYTKEITHTANRAGVNFIYVF